MRQLALVAFAAQWRFLLAVGSGNMNGKHLSGDVVVLRRQNLGLRVI